MQNYFSDQRERNDKEIKHDLVYVYYCIIYVIIVLYVVYYMYVTTQYILAYTKIV